jgi:hypothetical protein
MVGTAVNDAYGCVSVCTQTGSAAWNLAGVVGEHRAAVQHGTGTPGRAEFPGAQNGVQIHQSTKITVTRCPKTKQAKHKQRAKRKHRYTRREMKR